MSANMMYRLAAYSYFRAAVVVEKKKEEGGGGSVSGGLQPTLLLSTSKAPSRLSEQQKNVAASTAVTPFFSLSLFFSVFFRLQICVSKWQQMKTGMQTPSVVSIIHRGLKQILNKY